MKSIEQQLIDQHDAQTISESLVVLSKTIKEGLRDNMCKITLNNLKSIQKKMIEELIKTLYSER